MKKLIGLLFTLLLFTNTVFAFPNEPEGFRELKWGDSVKTLFKYYPDATFEKSREYQMNTSDSTVFNVYKVQLNNINLSTLKLNKEAEYVFHNNQFVGVILKSITSKSLNNIKNTESKFIENMVTLYGPPTETKTFYTVMDGRNPSRNNIDYFITRRSWTSYNKSTIMVETYLNLKSKKDHYLDIFIFQHNLWDNYVKSRISEIYKKEEIKNQGW